MYAVLLGSVCTGKYPGIPIFVPFVRSLRGFTSAWLYVASCIN